PEVTADILAADVVVLGPGSLYSSTIPPALVPSIRDAINRSAAKLVYVANIMTEVGETDGYDAFDHVEALVRHGVRAPDVVLVNSAAIDAERMQNYESEGAQLVDAAQERFERAGIRLVQLPLLGRGEYAQHDSLELARVLTELATAQTQAAPRAARAPEAALS
ncbi:MAG: 2-phospho-L-lactate transferase CofD family protein, partial [Trueperaceae bacterium]